MRSGAFELGLTSLLTVARGAPEGAEAEQGSCYSGLKVFWVAGKPRDLGRLWNRGEGKKKTSEGRKANAWYSATAQGFLNCIRKGLQGGFGFWSFGLWSFLLWTFFSSPPWILMLDGTLQTLLNKGFAHSVL